MFNERENFSLIFIVERIILLVECWFLFLFIQGIDRFLLFTFASVQMLFSPFLLFFFFYVDFLFFLLGYALLTYLCLIDIFCTKWFADETFTSFLFIWYKWYLFVLYQKTKQTSPDMASPSKLEMLMNWTVYFFLVLTFDIVGMCMCLCCVWFWFLSLKYRTNK